MAPDLSTGAGAAPRQPPDKRSWGRFLCISLLVHGLFLAGAGVWVVQVSRSPAKRTFQRTALQPGPSIPAVEHKVQMRQRAALSAPPAVKRALTLGPAKFALPSMPTLPPPPVIPVASRIPGMGGAGTSPVSGGAGAARSLVNSSGEIFAASIGGLKVQARRLAVALDTSASVAKYQADMRSFVQRTFKDSEITTFFSASFKTPRGGNSIGSVVTDFLNSPKQFDSIYVFSDFKTPARDQEEAWERLKQTLEARKVRLYLHVLQDFGANAHLTPAVQQAVNFARSSGGSVKIGPLPRL